MPDRAFFWQGDRFKAGASRPSLLFILGESKRIKFHQLAHNWLTPLK